MKTVDVTGLELDAVRVVERIVERLRMGQAAYGPLDLSTNPRDWRAEATEEDLDAAVYRAMQSVKDTDDRRGEAMARSTSATETRLFRAYCTPNELAWLDAELPSLQRRIRKCEGQGDLETARKLALDVLKGKRDLIEIVQLRMDGVA